MTGCKAGRGRSHTYHQGPFLPLSKEVWLYPILAGESWGCLSRDKVFKLYLLFELDPLGGFSNSPHVEFAASASGPLFPRRLLSQHSITSLNLTNFQVCSGRLRAPQNLFLTYLCIPRICNSVGTQQAFNWSLIKNKKLAFSKKNFFLFFWTKYHQIKIWAIKSTKWLVLLPVMAVWALRAAAYPNQNLLLSAAVCQAQW